MHTRHVEVRRWKEFRRSVGHLDDDRTTTCSESVTEENDKQSLIDLETDTKTKRHTQRQRDIYSDRDI